MYSSNPYLWYRQPGTSFYILENNSMVPWTRAYYQHSYNHYGQNHYQVNYPNAEVSIEEVEEVEVEQDHQEENHGDVESDDEIIDVVGGTEGFSLMGNFNELKSYEEEDAIANGNLDAPPYSPISMCSSLSEGTNVLIAENLGRVQDDDDDDEFEGEIHTDESSEVAVEDIRIGADCAEDGRVVAGGVMEYEDPVDVQLESNGHESGPELMDIGGTNNVQMIQVIPPVRKSSRLLKKSKESRDEAGDESPKNKVSRWMTRKCACCSDFSKGH